MTPERYKRIDALLDTVLELSADRREAFLAQACASDEELYRDVTELIAAHAGSEGFLTSPALEFLAPDLASELDVKEFVGRQIGRYQILSWIGSGGMGEVWLAADIQLGREVALKLVPSHFPGEQDQPPRLEREARAASALNHPNVVTIYEIGEIEGVKFIAQEFVPGETLRKHLDGGPMMLTEALDVASQIAAALAVAESAGIVHRDIKPENVMLRPDGLIKVLDFGLARFATKILQPNQIGASSSPGATFPGLVIGTANYMSPEQVRGLEVDARSDIFSLGIVLYEIVTGRTPFTGSTPADVLAAVLQNDPAPFPAHRPHDLYAEFEGIVRRCLEKEPTRRYQTAAELGADLSRLMRSIDSAARGTSPTTKPAAKFWHRRWRGLTMAAVIVATLVGVGIVQYDNASRGKTTSSFNSMQIRRLTTRGEVVDGAISPDGRFVAYALSESRGQSLWMRQVAATIDIRILPPESGDHRGVTFSPDGNYLYYLREVDSGTERLYKIPVLGGEARQILAAVNSPIAFAPGGRHFAFLRLDLARREVALMVANTDGTGERKIAARHPPNSYSGFGLAWSPEGRTIACFGNAGGADSDLFNLVGIRVADGREEPITTHGWVDAHSLVWSSDGRSLILAGKASLQDIDQIWLVSYPSGRVRKVTHDLNVYSTIGLTADGKTLAAVQNNILADIWTVPSGDTRRAVRVTSGNFRQLNSVAWTAGRRIVFSATGGDYQNIWAIDANGHNLKQLTSGPGYGNELATTPDGRYVLYQFEHNIWRVNIDGDDRRQLSHGVLDVHPCSSSDSRWVVYTSFENWSSVIGGKPTLWKMSIAGGDPIRLTQVSASLPQVSPDGKLIACTYFRGEDPRFSPSQLAIIPYVGGPPVKLIDKPPDAGDEVYWTAGGKALDYKRAINGVDNIWRQQLSGGPPTKVTDFATDRLFTFAWSRDGTQLAVVRGRMVNDIVLITDFQ